MDRKTGKVQEMTKTTPIWPINEIEINKTIAQLKNQIAESNKHAGAWEERSNNAPAGNPDKAFFALAAVQQHNYVESLEMYLSVLQWSIELNRDLAKKLEYLEGNIQTIAKKFKIQIATMKQEVTNAQLVNSDVYKMMKQAEKDNERLKKMGETNVDFATRSR